MNELVCGVGVNDLGYRTQVEEEVTKNGGKRIRKIVLNANIMQRGLTCYKDATAKNTWKANQAILELASVASGCTLQHLKNGWRNKTGVGSV